MKFYLLLAIAAAHVPCYALPASHSNSSTTMKKIILLSASALLLTACVSMREYESLQSRYTQSSKESVLAKQELQELREENAELVRQNQAMTAAMSDLAASQQECETSLATLNRAYAALQLHYDTTIENYMQQLTGKNRDLSKVNKMLEQRTKELTEKERAYAQKERQLQERQQELDSWQALMEQDEEIMGQAIDDKNQELEDLRNAVTKALIGFSDMGLNIEVKEGKVYVSMTDKLLFASGSWEVSDKGVSAIKELAKVLEKKTDLTIMVEGHTDNDAFHGSTAVKDNWDLSVMRATAIVKLLLANGPKIDPARVEAAGHAEYAPKVKNVSAANKAINRRTEIILTPHHKDIIDILDSDTH